MQDDDLPYLPFDRIDFSLTHGAFRKLVLFDDMFLNMQAMNIAMIDNFITEGEYHLLQTYIEIEKTPLEDAMFISAQSQMWIFALYELLRTWKQRVQNLKKWQDSGALQVMLKNLDQDTTSLGALIKTRHIERAISDPNFIPSALQQVTIVDPLFQIIEAIRINLAKHEIKGKRNSVVSAPGYGRINMLCGALDFELDMGDQFYRTINRRDLADMLRSMELPSVEG